MRENVGEIECVVCETGARPCYEYMTAPRPSVRPIRAMRKGEAELHRYVYTRYRIRIEILFHGMNFKLLLK